MNANEDIKVRLSLNSRTRHASGEYNIKTTFEGFENNFMTPIHKSSQSLLLRKNSSPGLRVAERI